MNFYQTIGGRFQTDWINDGHNLGRMHKTVLAVEGSVDDLKAATEKVKSLGTLNDNGIREKIREYAAGKTIKEFNAARSEIKSVRANIEDRRAKLGMPVIDRKDVVAAIERQELRRLIREMPDQDRRSFVTQHLQQTAEAILEKPAFVSGLSDEFVAESKDRFVKMVHADALARLGDEDEAVTLADSALNFAHGELQKSVGLEGRKHEFDTFIETHTPKPTSTGLPYKVKTQEQI